MSGENPIPEEHSLGKESEYASNLRELGNFVSMGVIAEPGQKSAGNKHFLYWTLLNSDKAMKKYGVRLEQFDPKFWIIVEKALLESVIKIMRDATEVEEDSGVNFPDDGHFWTKAAKDLMLITKGTERTPAILSDISYWPEWMRKASSTLVQMDEHNDHLRQMLRDDKTIGPDEREITQKLLRTFIEETQNVAFRTDEERKEDASRLHSIIDAMSAGEASAS